MIKPIEVGTYGGATVLVCDVGYVVPGCTFEPPMNQVSPRRAVFHQGKIFASKTAWQTMKEENAKHSNYLASRWKQ